MRQQLLSTIQELTDSTGRKPYLIPPALVSHGYRQDQHFEVPEFTGVPERVPKQAITMLARPVLSISNAQ